MTTLTFLDAPSNVTFFYRDPAEKIDAAMCEFCSRHRIPGRVTADAINLAQAHREKGKSVGVAIEHGKTHVRLWLAMNQPTGPEAA